MTEPFSRLRRFLRELKRRKVYRVAAGYLVAAFVVLQLAGLASSAFGFPGWFEPMIWVVAGLGFPLAVVLAWAFEVTPEGVRRTPEAEPAEQVEAPEAGTRTGYKVLVGLGLAAAVVAGGWYLTGGGGESPEVTDGTVAVLPFEVAGSAEGGLRDGMVSLLSTGLDGAAGLRAIPYQTVLATWERTGSEKTGATVEEALASARRTGARYGVVGTVTGVGSELQLSATAYETTSGDRLGQVEVTGTPDSVTAVAGELTRRVLGLLAAETGEELRAADLASVTTRSDTALRAFLAGERHRRAGNLDSAIVNYQAAIRADSTFALPYARLAFRGLWHGAFRGQHMRRAYELAVADQLPERQRRLVRALYLGRVERRTLAARDSLRRLTEDYPDDPMIWQSLGEFVSHADIPRGLPEVERAHERAVELDPGNTEYYDHYVRSAFKLHHDSALVAERVNAVPHEQWRRLYRLAHDVIYGDSAHRQRALSAYDTVSIPLPWLVDDPFGAPQYLNLRETVLRRVMNRDDMDPELWAPRLSVIAVFQGRIEQFLADMPERQSDEDALACVLANFPTLGYPVPDSVAARFPAPDNLPDEPSLRRFKCAGVYLVESGRGDELNGLIRRLRATVDTTGPDGVLPAKREAVVQELRGYRAWKQGDLERAARLWDRSNESGTLGALWRGDLYRELGRLETAEGWYLAAWEVPDAHERLGQLYEDMDKPEKAAAAYRRFIAAWEDADPELQPRVEAARERLKELTAAEADADD